MHSYVCFQNWKLCLSVLGGMFALTSVNLTPIRNTIQRADFVNQCIYHPLMTHENWMHSPLCRVRCCSGLKPILNGIRMHVVSFPQLLKTITMLLLYAEGTFWAFVTKFGPTSCMGVPSNGCTAVTQNHITTSFDVQPKTQQASGYNTYNSCLSVKPLATSLPTFFFFPSDYSSILSIHNSQCFHWATGRLLG